MKKIGKSGILFFLIWILPAVLLAQDHLGAADALFEKGGLENYQQAIALYQKVLADHPDDYAANWKCARAYREYGDNAKEQNVEGWKKICAEYGKLGMQYAQKAIELKPNDPAGYYYYGLSVGTYSDGVSILTALGEGLKGKTQSSFEKAYELDKMFNKAGPMLSLGRFWAVLPWPMYNRKKSLAYYREYQQTDYFADNMEAHVYLAELLIQMGGKKNKAEAKGYLETATNSDSKFYSEKAKQLLPKVQ